MHVSPKQPFQLVYSLFQHEYLGYLFESFVVAVDERGELTLRYQNISAKNAPEFGGHLDDDDYEIISLMDSIQQDVVIKKFYNKKIAPSDFFLNMYDEESGNKLLQEKIHDYLEGRRAKILSLLGNKALYIMARDGNPADQPLALETEKATVIFHIRREDGGSLYFPKLWHKGEKLNFQHRDARIICSKPAWLMVNRHIYSFERNPDGKKLKPFLNKGNIQIPQKIEETYFRKFVGPLIENFDVEPRGFTIKNVHSHPQPILTVTPIHSQANAPSLFPEESGGVAAPPKVGDGSLLFSLSFQYDQHELDTKNPNACSVHFEVKDNGEFIFYRVMRNQEREREVAELLKGEWLPLKNGRAISQVADGISWLNERLHCLEKNRVEVKQPNSGAGPRYFLGEASIDVSIQEQNDWFDVHAVVKFGEYEVPFVKLRSLIMSDKREFTLPSGEVAVIPEAWLSKYSDLLHFIDEEQGRHTLHKHHLPLVQELENGNLAKVSINQKLEKLKDFDKIEDSPMPEGFVGTLRPYQKAGYNWLQFLNKYNFGGCLADDMGLGKTVQTLSLLQAQQEDEDTPKTSLLIMPTSLLYNWEMEAKKFTPNLRVYRYTGTNRDKNLKRFGHYDIVITSYGIIRIDIDLLEQFYFNYVILDESQVIKNPSSNIAKSVKRLRSRRKLILTGTPLENNTMDLWSQISFVNPGLLGSQKYFKQEFQQPIEKRQDEERGQRLHALIKPFILRRHKSQVATELPPKIEQVKFTEMSEAQAEYYESTKSYFRNKILEHIEGQGMAKSQMLLLQGLTMLRQIANHPLMVKEDFEGDSGKMKDILHMLESGLVDNHKILIFSQFVKHLGLLRKELKRLDLPYAYLDGSVKDRQREVEKFQQDDDTRLFLISLKAGGLGLNLTAADYVFILDPWWNPAIEAQAVDRAHRIGQDKAVFNYKFIARDTVEEKILALQQRKLKLASNLVTTEESFIKSLTKEDIDSLLT